MGDFAKLAHLPSRTQSEDKLHNPPYPLSLQRKGFLVSPWLPAPGPRQRSVVLRGELGWNAARPGVTQKGLTEKHSLGTRAALRPGTALPRLGAVAGLAGTPRGGEQAASRNDSKRLTASRRDLTVSRGRRCLPPGGASPTRRPSLGTAEPALPLQTPPPCQLPV